MSARLRRRIGRAAFAVVVPVGLVAAIGIGASVPVLAVEGRHVSAQDASGTELATTITSLGAFDLSVRSKAAQTLRRAPADRAVPALTQAAQGHTDSYVRYRALVLLSSFGHPSTAQTMRGLLADKDDRVRTVASAWFEHHPDPAALPALIESLGRERSEYVRPALTRAIAAHGADPRARDVLLPLVTRGEDVYRGAVIDALGDYRAVYALKDISAVAVLDGPLQDDAITAVGRIGDRSGLAVLSTLQQSGPASVKPAIAAAVCLMGLDCQAQQDYLEKALGFAAGREGNATLLRSAGHAMGVLAASGRVEAMTALFDAGVPLQEPARTALALPLGMAALRNPTAAIAALERVKSRDAAIELLRDSFDLLSQEDYEQERFFVAVRNAIGAAPAGSPRRAVAEAIARKLEI